MIKRKRSLTKSFEHNCVAIGALISMTLLLGGGCPHDERTSPPQPSWATSSDHARSNGYVDPSTSVRGSIIVSNQSTTWPRNDGGGEGNYVTLFVSTSEDGSSPIAGTNRTVDLSNLSSSHTFAGEIYSTSIPLGLLPQNQILYICADVSGSWVRPETGGTIGHIIIGYPPNTPTYDISIGNIQYSVSEEPDIIRVTVDALLPGSPNVSVDRDDHAIVLYLSAQSNGSGVVARTNVAYFNRNNTGHSIFELNFTPSLLAPNGGTFYLRGTLYLFGNHSTGQVFTINTSQTVILDSPPAAQVTWNQVWLEPQGNTEDSWYNRCLDYPDGGTKVSIREVLEAFSQLKIYPAFIRNDQSAYFDNFSTQNDGYYHYWLHNDDPEEFQIELETDLLGEQSTDQTNFVVALGYVDLDDGTNSIEPDRLPVTYAYDDGLSLKTFIFLQLRRVHTRVAIEDAEAYWFHITRSAWPINQELAYIRGVLAHEMGHALDYKLDPHDHAYEHEDHGGDEALGARECIMNNGVHWQLDGTPDDLPEEGEVYTTGFHLGLTSNPHFCSVHINKWIQR